MSEILWCDLGNHQFSANDSERKVQVEDLTYVQQQRGEKPKRFDMCGECQRGLQESGDPVKSFFNNLVKGPKALSKGQATKAQKIADNIAGKADPDYVAWLENQTNAGSVSPDL